MASPFTINDLTTPVTRDEAKGSIYSVLAQLGVNTTVWKPGAVVRTIITACAIIIAALSVLISKVARSGFLDYAEGAWLKITAKQVYNVDKAEATFATGEVTVDNEAGGVYSPGIGDVIFRNSVTKKTYRNTEAFSIGALETGVVVAVEALEVGTASNASPGTVTEFETPLNGLVVTNAAAIVATDEQGDPSLRQDCRNALGALSPNGPADAYTAVAKKAKRSDGSSIGITRVRHVKDGKGGLDVYLATPTGGITGDTDDPLTDLGAANDDIQRLAAPLGVTVRVHSATAVPIAVTYEAWLYKSNLDDATILAAVAAQITDELSTSPIGGHRVGLEPGRIYRSALEAVIGKAVDDDGVVVGIFRVSLPTPASDVDLAYSEAPVAGTITGTINQLAPPGGI